VPYNKSRRITRRGAEKAHTLLGLCEARAGLSPSFGNRNGARASRRGALG
jgi:hypothetical protein